MVKILTFFIFNDLENDYHLWTIQDAKDGDVLCYGNEISLYKHDIKNCNSEGMTFGGFVYYCCYDGKRFVVDSLYSLTEQDRIDIHPATKEQRDTLMKAMADAGYIFDFEKKELKKIEQKPADKKGMNLVEEEMTPFQKKVFCIIDTTIEEEQGLKQVCDELLRLASNEIKQKHTEWSEEDEYHKRQILRILKDNGCSQTLQEKTEKWIEERLKSLRHKLQWKPSDEQIQAVKVAACYSSVFSEKTIDSLISLSEQLKKLKEE